MRSLNWKDLHLTPNEYVEMFAELLKKSEFFTDMESSWHPEDLAANAEVVFETMNDTLVLYIDILRNKMNTPAYDPNNKTVDDMKKQAANSEPKTGTPSPTYAGNDPQRVFGGTLPRGEWDNYVASPVPPRGSRQDVFGDNA